MLESFGAWIGDNKEWLFSGLAISLITIVVRLLPAIVPKEKLRLRGEWNIFVDGAVYGRMSFRQAFFFVWASSEIQTKDKAGSVMRYRFSYFGMISGDQVVMKYREQGQERRIVGSSVLRMMRNQNEMQGGNIFWHHDKSKIEDVKFTLRRQH